MDLKLPSILAVGAILIAPTAFAEVPDSVAASAFKRADKIIKDSRLLTPKAYRCAKFVLRDDSDRAIVKIGVYEIHDKDCGGDPDAEHRLFDLEINMKTGAAKWDNNLPDMEMRPVPKRR